MSEASSKKEKLLLQLENHHVAGKLSKFRRYDLAELLDNLKKVAESGEGWSACCPNHADSKPSLSIGVEHDGRFLLHCHRGCEFDDVVQAAGMLETEMFDSVPSTRSAVLPPRRRQNEVPTVKVAEPSWAARHSQFRRSANKARLEELASQLNVTVASLRSIEVGWCRDKCCWTFPERNGEQAICGIVRRFPNGKKYAFKGGHRGLTLPKDWDKSDQLLHICEGASDVAAAISSGLRAIGRPGLQSGFNDLGFLLKEERSKIVMVADNDVEGAGRGGARKLAQRLSDFLGRKISVVAPPAKYKDLREFLSEKKI